MRSVIILTILSLCTLISLSACGDTSVNVNTDRMASKAGNAVNAAVNTAANAVNSAANAIDRATVDSPEDFMTEAARGGLAEVELGKLAATTATDPEVKKFGQRMVTDHSRINGDLKQLAKTKNITLPTDMGAKSSDLDDLKKLKGADFDEEYVEQMVAAHRADVEAFENQSKYSTDQDVKAFAAKALPMLKEHLDAIERLQKSLKNK